MTLRPDLARIAERINPGEKLLDIGCENGDLLAWLRDHHQVDGRGLELNQSNVNAAVARGLFVIQGDADHDLTAFPDQSFDVVVLSRTLPAVQNVEAVLKALVRIGKRAIVTIPNAAHWRARLRLLTGHIPTGSELIQRPWHQTRSLHPASLKDLESLIAQMPITLVERQAYGRDGSVVGTATANWRARTGLFVLKRQT